MTFSGILPAVATPLNEEEEFIPRSFELLLEHIYEAGVHGAYVSGQTGEGPLQPIADREKVIEVAVKNTPKNRTVIVHVGAQRTADAIRLAKFASQAGADAVSSLPPFGLYTRRELTQYYERLAAAASCPVLVYYFPVFSEPVSSLEAQLELLAIENVAGIKFTDFDLFRLSELKQTGACVFNGRDEVLVAGLLMGADGGIGSFYNLVPELFVALYNRTREDDWAEARRLQQRINELIGITKHFPMLSAIKTMLGWSGIPCGPCFEPRRRLTAEEETALAEKLSRSSFAGAGFAVPR